MNDVEQLVFDVFASVPSVPAPPSLKRGVAPGPGRLLRRLVTLGLADDALMSAAQLVAALDEAAPSNVKFPQFGGVS